MFAPDAYPGDKAAVEAALLDAAAPDGYAAELEAVVAAARQ
jgi:hypothetical protein